MKPSSCFDAEPTPNRWPGSAGCLSAANSMADGLSPAGVPEGPSGAGDACVSDFGAVSVRVSAPCVGPSGPALSDGLTVDNGNFTGGRVSDLRSVTNWSSAPSLAD